MVASSGVRGAAPFAGRVVEDIGKHRAGGGAAAKGGEKHGFPLGRGTVGCSPDLEGDPTVTQLLEVILQLIRCPLPPPDPQQVSKAAPVPQGPTSSALVMLISWSALTESPPPDSFFVGDRGLFKLPSGFRALQQDGSFSRSRRLDGTVVASGCHNKGPRWVA